MYDDLRRVLRQSQQLDGWYALGNALRLSQAIEIVSTNHENDPESPETQESLLKVAQRTDEFLRRMGNNRSPETLNALQTLLTYIELEM